MSRRLATAFAALSALAILVMPAQSMPMEGSYIGHVDSQEPKPLGPNRIRLRQTASGSNSGPGTPLDGARVTWEETVMLKNGSGPVTGIITFTTPSGSTSSAYRGRVATDAQGRVTASGTYRNKAATGAFAGLKGKGTFTAAYSSKTDFTGGWQGEVVVPRQKTSSR